MARPIPTMLVRWTVFTVMLATLLTTPVSASLLDAPQLRNTLLSYARILRQSHDLSRDQGPVWQRLGAIRDAGLRQQVVDLIRRSGSTTDAPPLLDPADRLYAIVSRREQTGELAALGSPYDSFIMAGKSIDSAAGSTGTVVAAAARRWMAANIDILLDNLEQLAVGIDAMTGLPANEADAELNRRGAELLGQRQDVGAFVVKFDRLTVDFEAGLYDPGAATALGLQVHPAILAALRRALTQLGNDEQARAKAARLQRAIAQIDAGGIALSSTSNTGSNTPGPAVLTAVGGGSADAGLYAQLARSAHLYLVLWSGALARSLGIDSAALHAARGPVRKVSLGLLNDLLALRRSLLARMQIEGEPRIEIGRFRWDSPPHYQIGQRQVAITYNHLRANLVAMRAVITANRRTLLDRLAAYSVALHAVEDAGIAAIRATEARQWQRRLLADAETWQQRFDLTRPLSTTDRAAIAELVTRSESDPVGFQLATYVENRAALARKLTRLADLDAQLRGERPMEGPVADLEAEQNRLRQEAADDRSVVNLLAQRLGLDARRAVVDSTVSELAGLLPAADARAAAAERTLEEADRTRVAADAALGEAADNLVAACATLQQQHQSGSPLITAIRISTSTDEVYVGERQTPDQLLQLEAAVDEARTHLCDIQALNQEAEARFRTASSEAIAAGHHLYRMIWASGIGQLGVEVADFFYETLRSEKGPLLGALTAAVKKGVDVWVLGEELIIAPQQPLPRHWSDTLNPLETAAQSMIKSATSDPFAEDPLAAMQQLRAHGERVRAALQTDIDVREVVTQLKSTLKSPEFVKKLAEGAGDIVKDIAVDTLKAKIADYTEGEALRRFVEADLTHRGATLWLVHSVTLENRARDAMEVLLRRQQQTQPRAELSDRLREFFSEGERLQIELNTETPMGREVTVWLGGRLAERTPSADRPGVMAFRLRARALTRDDRQQVALRVIVKR